MPLMGEFREEREQIKKAPFPQKVQYFKDYYLLPTIFIVFVSVVMILLLRSTIFRHPESLSVTMINFMAEDSAEENVKKAFEKNRIILGEEDPETLASVERLAEYYDRIGEYDKAIELEEELLSKRNSLFGSVQLQFFQLFQGLGIYTRIHAADTFQVIIMENNDLSILRQLDIEL